MTPRIERGEDFVLAEEKTSGHGSASKHNKVREWAYQGVAFFIISDLGGGSNS